ncbi:MAG: hypothetical protein J1G02_00625 [Clostridiales bacterium]|nr:hypothetical protein [Clostridiales bacterium]
MIIYNIFIAICFALLTAEVVYVVVSLARKKRAERVAYIRSFKKGKCIVIFISTLPLYFMGYLYAGTGVARSLIETIGQVVNLVVLKYSFSAISALMQDNLFFTITVYYSAILVAINAVMVTISVLGQRFWMWLQSVKARFSAKDKLYILGYNDNNLDIYESDNKCCKMIADDVDEDGCYGMYVRKIYYNSCKSFDKVIEHIFKGVSNGKIAQHTVVINTENDDKNIIICNLIVNKIVATESSKRNNLFNRLRIYVFGNSVYSDIYGDIVERSYGCIRYVNKHQKIAMGFVDRYPLTQFMDERHLDYNTACVRENVDINVCMIGFGKVNQEVFLTSVANNQFVTMGTNGVKLKAVNYHIFDKNPSENNKNLNHSYYRFRNECSDVDEAQYLPMPELPATEQYYHLDINDPKFYDIIRKVSSNATGVNFVIIAFGTDLENIDLAKKLIAKRREWGMENLVIFVRVEDWKKEEHIFDENNCYVFGDDKTDVYNIDEIVADKIFRMAHMRNELYALEYQITCGNNLDLDLYLTTKAEANCDWFQRRKQIERESNLYGCLSLRSKLNMIGLDYCSQSDERPALSESEYLAIYAKDDPIVYATSSDIIEKKVVSYTLDFPESLRKNLAIHEHYRWNSYMISKGMIPSTKEQIENEVAVIDGEVKNTNGKNYQLRRHGNLTTFDGLVEFREIVARRDKRPDQTMEQVELNKDVIKYDYQLMDDAYWLLAHNGYKIIKR